MARIVMKFGGTSVADVDRIRQAARHVKREIDAGHQVCVVVSAMAGKTNELVAWCRQAASLHDAREYDAVVASGEQVTAGLMAIVLSNMGIPSRSFSGWQVPIKTDDAHGSARIADIDPATLNERMENGWVPVITGFQGIAPSGRITTLGRGGSDTSAVAVAAAEASTALLSAEQFYALLCYFDDTATKMNWLNLPMNLVPRNDEASGDLTDEQLAAAKAVA